MNCPQCGAQNEDRAKECKYCGSPLDRPRQVYEPGHFSFPGHDSQPQQPQQQAPPQPGQYGPPGGPPPYQTGPGPYGPGGVPPKVPNYMVLAVLVTVLCCIPGGVVAIVYASKVNSRNQIGDYHGALAASKKVKLWIGLSVGAGLLYVIFMIIAGLTTA